MKDPQRRPSKGLTLPTRANLREPRLPHERDESSDSQTEPPAEVREVGRQAAQDLQRGLVDTDRGPVLDRLYARQFKRALRKRR